VATLAAFWKLSEKFKTGSLIAGSYRVLDFIGEGAMGLVYKVEHTLLNKILAFKVLKTEFLSEAIWKRFRLEGQAIARLDHVNIVKIYDMSQTEDGLPFFTMDLLVGQSLDDYLQDYGRLSVEDALPIFRQVCAGLAYANDHGIIHRDIKPGNIMLIDSKDGSIGKCTVKIVDFGIAKLVDDGNTSQQGLTRPGEVFGSPLYMSPEQCMGAKLDQRTDMYSVGITMFQALAGKPPLLGKSAVETAALHQSQEPPMLCDVAPDVEFPIELEEVIATMLAKSPDDRYSSLAEVANLLLQIEKGEVDVSHTQQQSLRQPFKQNENDDGEDQETDHQNNHHEQQVSKKQVWLVASLTVVSLAAVLFLVTTSNLLVQRDKEPAKSNPIAPMKNPKTVAFVDQVDPLTKFGKGFDETKLSEQETKDIEAFRKTHSGNYSRLVSRNGQAIKVFDFSDKFSIGTISWQNQKERGQFEARGTKEMPICRNVKLDSSLAVQTYPDLLTKFRQDELNWLVIDGVKPANPKLATSIVHLASLNRLDIRNSELTNSDLKTLEQLKSLTILSLSGSTVGSADLAQCLLLKQLTVLQVESIKEPTILLEKLLQYNKLLTLDLRHIKLQHKDFDTISKISTLHSLTVKSTNIRDEDLKTLTKLANLKQLNLDCCANLTVQSIETLGKFSELRLLSLPFHLNTKQNNSKLKQLIPALSIKDPED
jgi:serine/threonine protein kinase